MNIQQYEAIYRGLIEARVQFRVCSRLALTEFARTEANASLAVIDASIRALDEVDIEIEPLPIIPRVLSVPVRVALAGSPGL